MTRSYGTTKRQVRVIFEKEKPFLQTLPLNCFEYCRVCDPTVNFDGYVEVDGGITLARRITLTTELQYTLGDYGCAFSIGYSSLRARAPDSAFQRATAHTDDESAPASLASDRDSRQEPSGTQAQPDGTNPDDESNGLNYPTTSSTTLGLVHFEVAAPGTVSIGGG